MERTKLIDGHPPELLVPGGSYEKIQVAFRYGADAVYCGGPQFNLRNQAKNLGMEELAAAVFLARRLGRRLYVTVNAFARNGDLKTLPGFLEYLGDLWVDGIIVADPGVLRLAHRHAAGIPVHLSTQANTTNTETVRFWRDLGVRRVNLARELALDEVREIRTVPGIELEVFVHGAMCMAYSGRCLLSSFLTGRSANRGLCTQPCRWSYRLVEEKRPGEYFPLGEEAGSSFILNSKDLCLIDHLAALAEVGVDSLKIEGRMKGALYVATVTRAYRAGLNFALTENAAPQMLPSLREELDRVSHRPYTAGALFSSRENDAHLSPHEALSPQTFTLAGLVRSDPGYRECLESFSRDLQESCIWLEVRSRLIPGMVLEFLNPDGSSRLLKLESMEDVRGNRLASAHPNTLVRIPVSFDTFPSQVVRTRVGEFPYAR